MSRRLLGYVVKLPSGEWHDGKNYKDKDFDGYPWTKDAKKRHVFTEYQDACRYVLTYVSENGLRVVPVFSKPKPAEPKPAPVVAAERWYACLCAKGKAEWFEDIGALDEPCKHLDTHDEAVALAKQVGKVGRVVRVLEDGEHEAALAAAREEGRREAAGRLARLVDALQNVLDGHSELTPHAIVEIEYVLEEEREAAAKGAAK